LKAIRVGLGFVFALGIAAGCASSKQTTSTDTDTATTADASGQVMPDVVGLKLDIALDKIKQAGFDNDVDIVGGGTFGVVKKSNWQVCDQTPAPGLAMTTTPQLTVDRSCSDTSTETSAAPLATTAPPTTETVDASTSAPAETPPPTPTTDVPVTGEILTAATNADTSALLTGTDTCAASIATFASTYLGRTIEFDGAISNVAKHGDNVTRYDVLVSGDPTNMTAGPEFQFRDVGMFDLHLTGPNVPDFIGAGNHVHVVAKVGVFESDHCLFLLDPLSTTMN